MKNSEVAEQVNQWWYVTCSMSGALGIRPVSELHALNVMSLSKGGGPVGCTVIAIMPTSLEANEYVAELKRTMKVQRQEQAVELPCMHGAN